MTEQTTTGPLDITGEDFFDSLNGYEELAIAKHFKASPLALSDSDPSQFLRALVFAHQRRDGLKDSEAYAVAMNATMGDISGYFADEEPEPDSDAGKA